MLATTFGSDIETICRGFSPVLQNRFRFRQWILPESSFTVNMKPVSPNGNHRFNHQHQVQLYSYCYYC